MRIAIKILLLFCLLLTTDCGKSPLLTNFPESASSSGGSGGSSGGDSGGGGNGVKAPTFSLKDIDGNTVNFANDGGIVLMLVFWTTWCSPCRAEIPTIQSLQAEFAGKPFLILAVNDMEDQATVKSFCTTNNITYKVLLDTSYKVFPQYSVTAIPTCVIIDKNGYINKTLVGTHPADTDINPLL